METIPENRRARLEGAGTHLQPVRAPENCGSPAWWLILLLIPVVNRIAAVVVNIGLAKSFGKDLLYGLGITFLGFIFEISESAVLSIDARYEAGLTSVVDSDEVDRANA